MDLSTITVADFKSQFFRDFPYLNIWNDTQLYNNGNRVYFTPGLLFYDCTVNGTVGCSPPARPWAQAEDDIMNYVQDRDITNAFAEAQIVFNQTLFSEDPKIKLGYLYLTAHYLVNDLKAAQGGISSGAQMPLTGRSVGNVSENYQIPERYLKNPAYAFYITSAYGFKYLSMIQGKLVGNMAVLPTSGRCGGIW